MGLEIFYIIFTKKINMFSPSKYKNRRLQLIENIHSGIILLPGNSYEPINFPGNTYPFRQDSHFLYYFGINIPDIVGVIDVDSGEDYLFGNNLMVEDIVWTGEQLTLEELGLKSGVSKVFSMNRLESYLSKAIQLNRAIHFLPPYKCKKLLQLTEWLSLLPKEINENISKELISAIVQQRSIKDNEEINEIEEAINRVTSAMFLRALNICEPGIKESEILAQIISIAVAEQSGLAFQPICTVNGQFLHNNSYENVLTEGKLLLIDAGAESKNYYASDITRVFPVSKRFNEQQSEIYQIVLKMQQNAISAMHPGVTYFSVHKLACKIMVEGLKALGLLHGNTEEIVESGAHALFFPHGLGHLLGLDVHDMEDLGENNTGYDNDIQRSEQFGTKYLRYAKTLKEGLVLTVEPGIYFIPALINLWKKEKKFSQFINYNVVEKFLHLGGIRIEDDVVITTNGCRILGNPIPKNIAEIELLKIKD